MKNNLAISFLFLFLSLAFAHISPPVQLVTEQNAVSVLMDRSLKVERRHRKLDSVQREEIERSEGWTPSERNIRYYTGLDDRGTVRATVILVSEYTLHGSIRVAAACDGEDKLTGAELLEVSEESYNWIKPLLEEEYMKQVWQTENIPEVKMKGSMTKYYANEIAKLIHHVPVLCKIVNAVPHSSD